MKILWFRGIFTFPEPSVLALIYVLVTIWVIAEASQVVLGDSGKCCWFHPSKCL